MYFISVFFETLYAFFLLWRGCAIAPSSTINSSKHSHKSNTTLPLVLLHLLPLQLGLWHRCSMCCTLLARRPTHLCGASPFTPRAVQPNRKERQAWCEVTFTTMPSSINRYLPQRRHHHTTTRTPPAYHTHTPQTSTVVFKQLQLSSPSGSSPPHVVSIHALPRSTPRPRFPSAAATTTSSRSHTTGLTE